jgi:dimethylaniline monooxygenase (N-oxide forming)
LRLLQFKYPETVPTEFPNAVPGYEMSFNLHPREGYDLFTSKGGVDHESYAYQLALDMGAAPTFSFVRKKGFKVLYAWAMGANFNPKFRLVGPWKVEEEAEEIMRVELYGVVKRSGGVVCKCEVNPLLLLG